mmetsp:Transcript_93953/g.292750  ORF Transcript_93953/g.292750 Transcript_93953/m.292750 type:complete len:256 (-) Transcript_93953:800-1567(-)
MPRVVACSMGLPSGGAAKRTKPRQLWDAELFVASPFDSSSEERPCSRSSSSASPSDSPQRRPPPRPPPRPRPPAPSLPARLVRGSCGAASAAEALVKRASASRIWPAEVTTVWRKARAPPSAKAGRSREMSTPSRLRGLRFTTSTTSWTCSQFCMRSTSARSSMHTSIEERKSNSRFRSPSAPVICRRPRGEQKSTSLRSKGAYSLTAFFWMARPRRKRSSWLPRKRWRQSGLLSLSFASSASSEPNSSSKRCSF